MKYINTQYYDEEQFREKFKSNYNIAMFHLNSRSIPEHSIELTSYIHSLNIDFKIIGISETWLNPFHTNYMGNIERASTSRSLVRIPISNESLYHATQKKNHGYSTSISMPTTRADIDSDVDQHRGHVCSKAATTRGVV